MGLTLPNRRSAVVQAKRKRVMRKALIAITTTLLGFALPGQPAQAQHYEYQRRSAVYGVGCYWHRGRHYCNRYCYREVDGFVFCQPRLRDAGSQAPPLIELYPWKLRDPRVRRYRYVR